MIGNKNSMQMGGCQWMDFAFWWSCHRKGLIPTGRSYLVSFCVTTRCNTLKVQPMLQNWENMAEAFGITSNLCAISYVGQVFFPFFSNHPFSSISYASSVMFWIMRQLLLSIYYYPNFQGIFSNIFCFLPL